MRALEPVCGAKSVAAFGLLKDFDNVCVSLAMGVFDGFCALDSFRLLEEVSIEDCRRFVAENLAPERLAMAVITPRGGGKKAEDA